MRASGLSDSIPDGFSRPLRWNVSIAAGASYVPMTNNYLKGDNPYGKSVGTDFSADVLFGFSFSTETLQGMLYPGLYQSLGLSANFFSGPPLTGRPVSVYVCQGAPVAHFAERFWLGYEWQFGAAFGWKHYNADISPDNLSMSTSTTAHIGLGLTLNYELSAATRLTVGLGARHFSNGNTEWPNGGLNTAGLSLGVAYKLGTEHNKSSQPTDIRAVPEPWLCDIMAFGAWRKRAVDIDGTPQLIHGHFAVAGLQISPMRRFNQWVAAGPALDLMWDEGANLESNRVEDSYGDDVRFYRPSFTSQLSVGVSAHAELTTPIFSVNAGLGYDFVKPKGDNRFYQSLTLKTFVWRGIFVNVGYRLSDFKTPQNLMLGLGYRL